MKKTYCKTNDNKNIIKQNVWDMQIISKRELAAIKSYFRK